MASENKPAPFILETQTQPKPKKTVEEKHDESLKQAVTEAQKASLTSLDVVRQINSNFWDDYQLLLPKISSKDRAKILEEENAFTYRQIAQEGSWMSLEYEKLNVTNNKNKPNYKFCKPLAHTRDFVVAVVSDSDPNMNESKPKTNETTSQEPVYWPPLPPDNTIHDWHLKGFKNNIVVSKQEGKEQTVPPTKPFLFGTFETLLLDALIEISKEENEEPAKEQDQPKASRIETIIQKRTDAILRFLGSVRDARQAPLQYSGKLLIGKILNNTETFWNTSIDTKVPFHAVAAILEEADYHQVALMAICYNRTVYLWDLNTPEKGPLASIYIEEIKRKVISDMIITSEFVAILDGQGQLIVVPYNLEEFYHLRSHHVKDPKFKEHAQCVWSLGKSEKFYLVLNAPTAFCLSTNPADPRVFCIGTSHGYVHELGLVRLFPEGFKTSEWAKFSQLLKKRPVAEEKGLKVDEINLYHMRTFCTRSGQPVDFVQARNGRTLALTNLNAYMFHDASIIGNDTKHLCVMIETDGNDKAKFRNASFAGNLLFTETASRHFFVIDFVRNRQRIIPSTLGTIKVGDDDEERKYLIQEMPSLLYVDSHRGVLRTFYATLAMETIQLPPLKMKIPSFEKFVNDSKNQNESLDKLFEKMELNDKVKDEKIFVTTDPAGGEPSEFAVISSITTKDS